MEVLPHVNNDHPSKRARLGNGPEPIDQPVEAKAGTSIPELENIKQSNNQLTYLQAQLAATEALQAAYQAELLAVSERLRDIKRAHLRSGQPLWKDTSEAAEASRRLTTTAASCDEDLETFSDIEEEVLLLSPDSTAAAHADPHHQQQQPCAAPSAAQASAPDFTTATGEGLEIPGDAPAGAQEAPGEGTGNAAGPGPNQAAGVDGARGADPDGQPGAVPVTARELSRLEALEAACSAVAQEDMEAQGALACLAGRAGKYYLRSIVVTLGRATESKGEVDVDLTPEEGPVAAPQGGNGPPAAAAAGGGGEGAGAAGAGAATAATGAVAGGGGVQATAPAQAPSAGGAEGAGSAGGGGAEDGAGGASGGGAEGGGGAGGGGAPGGRGHRVSRRQALIRLGPDGQFRLVNMGRQPVLVNDVTVNQHQTVTLPHLSLIEVADVRLLFMANLAAVTRVVRRSAALVL